MDELVGWKLDQDDVLQLRLLEHVAEHGRWPDICSLPDWASSWEPARTILSEFNDRGLLDMYESGATPNLMISGVGASVARRVREHREDLQARDAGLHDALLAWLDHEAVRGRTDPVVDGFFDSPFGRWFGEPYEEQEVANATSALRHEGLIAGSETSVGGVPRPRLEPSGRRLSRSGRSFFDYPSGATGGDTFNITQTAQTLTSEIAGRESTQSMTVTLSQSQHIAIAELIELLNELTMVQPQSGAAEAAIGLRQATAGGDVGPLQRALIAAQGAALAAIGTDVGNQVMRLTHNLLQGLS